MFEMIFFGTCGGMEPIPGMRHTSFAIKKNGEYYWFDAGDGCGRTAHLMGENLANIKTIAISHPHIDHTEGLVSLLNYMTAVVYQEQVKRQDENYKKAPVPLFLPRRDVWDCVKGMFDACKMPLDAFFEVKATEYSDDAVYSDENISVSALSNTHMKGNFGDEKISFSFKIEIDGKKVIYSGDFGGLSDLDPLFDGGCDYLIIESGHLPFEDILKYAEVKKVPNVFFIHHGRFIVNNRDEAECMAKAYPGNAVILADKQKIIVE